MEDGIIYTFGSIDTLVIILEGLAVLFDPGQNAFFSSGSGLGIGVGGTLAATLALVGVFTNYISTQKLMVHGPLVGLLVYAVVAVPKIDRIFVSDLYTGETVAVSDVPLGVAVVGVVMSTIAYNIIETSERAYGTSPISGSPYEAKLSQGQGFLSPMKTLFKLRQNITPATPSHLVYNIFSYSKYCLYRSVNRISAGKPAGNPNFDMYVYSTSPNALTTYFLDADLIDPNLTAESMNPTNGQQSFVTCGALRTTLAADAPGGINYFLNDGATFGRHLLTQLASSDETMLSNCAGGGVCLDGATAITKTKDVIGQILGGVAQAEAYMESRMASDFNSMVALSPNLNAESLAQTTSMSREAIEIVRLTEVLEGETFLRFMIPAMNSILFIFYATFPLAMVIMITKGAESLKYLGGFMLIGVWAYSWMPVATVINLITIANVAEALNTSRGLLGINVASSPQMLELAMDQLATGSNLLAATPIITLAIISGSLYALTSVASNSASPSGATGNIARSNTPSAHTGSSLASIQPQYSDVMGRKDAGAMETRVGGIAATRTVGEVSNHSAQVQALNTKQSQLSSGYQQTLSNVLGSGQTTSDGRIRSLSNNMSAEQKSQVMAVGEKAFSDAKLDTSSWGEEEREAKTFMAGAGMYANGEIGTGLLAKIYNAGAKKLDIPELPTGNGANNGANTGGGAVLPGENGARSQQGGNASPNKGGGLPGINIGAQGNTNWSMMDSELDSIKNSIAAEAKTSNSDRVSNSDAAGQGQSIALSDSETQNVEASASLSKLRNLSGEMSSISSEVNQLQNGAGAQMQFSESRNMSLQDMYRSLAGNGHSPSGYHADHLSGLMRDAGFNEDEVRQGLASFKANSDQIRSDLYGKTTDSPDANFYAGTDAYDMTAASATSNPVFNSTAKNNAFKDTLEVAGATQFDFQNPNAQRSEQVGQIMKTIANGHDSSSPGTPASSPRDIGLNNEQRSVVQATAGGAQQQVQSDGMSNQSYEGLSSRITEEATTRSIQSASDNFQANGFTPTRSPVQGASTLKEGYFSDKALDTYAQNMYPSNVGPKTEFSQLNKEEQNNVMAQAANGAMSEIARGIDGTPPPAQANLARLNSNDPTYMQSASRMLNQASQVPSVTNGTNANASEIGGFIDAVRDETNDALTAGQRAFDNGNKIGGSPAEYQGLIQSAFNSTSPQQFNESVSNQQSRVSAAARYDADAPGAISASPSIIDGVSSDRLYNADTSTRSAVNENKFYQSAAIPQGANIGPLEQVANTMAKSGVIREGAGNGAEQVAGIMDDIANDPTNFMFDMDTFEKNLDNTTYNPRGDVLGMFMGASDQKVTSTLSELSKSDPQKAAQVRQQLDTVNRPSSIDSVDEYMTQTNNILQNQGLGRL